MIRWKYRGPVFLCLLLAAAWPVTVRGEYHRFNTAPGADGIVQEVRWPAWPHTYNAIYSNQNPIRGTKGESAGFYGGMPFNDENPVAPCKIIWSFWPVKGRADTESAVSACWTGPNMYAPLHEGEGAAGKVAGDWPLLTTNRWYREVLRIWPAADGTPDTGYAARWLRDSATARWYHLATMKIPFTPTGLGGPLTGFQEGLGVVAARRTDYRNVYYRSVGAPAWQPARQFSVQVKRDENATAGLIDNATGAFFETSKATDYLRQVVSHPPAVTGCLYLAGMADEPSAQWLFQNPPPAGMVVTQSGGWAATLTITNQPASPPLDPLVVTNRAAVVAGTQLLVSWQVPLTSSPQYSYRVEVFNNPGCAGNAAVTCQDIDPEARQKLMDITGVSTPFVRLTVVDVMDQTNGPTRLTPVPAALNVAAEVTGLVPGLAYAYYEATSNFNGMPDFTARSPVYQGAVDYPDLTLRRKREQYAFNYTGYLNVPTAGLYTFTLNSSDGSKLSIDGNRVVNWDGEHSAADKSGWAGLQAGLHAVNVQYFFDTDNANAHDLTDRLTVSWAGPGWRQTAVPAAAWQRVPAPGEPAVALTSPAAGATLCGTNVALAAAVANNRAAVGKVAYYVGEYYWGSDATLPHGLKTMMWANPSNAIRARVFYNGTHTVDSAPSVVATTNMCLDPWSLAVIGSHLQPVGAAVQGERCSIMGDGLNLLSQPVSGDCTIVGHVASLGTVAGTSPDGQAPGSNREAGLMLRQNTKAMPGQMLGGKQAPYVCLFQAAKGESHFEDDTMHNAGGSFASASLGDYSWFKIQRSGDTFTSYVSADGAVWKAVNRSTLAGIGPVLNVGVFTCAASSANPNVLAAGFDHVSLRGNILRPPLAGFHSPPGSHPL